MRIAEFRFVSVVEEPQDIESGVVYHSDSEKIAWFRCPCGCNDRLALNLANGKPAWTISGTTIKPSVQRTIGCKSHFNIVDGKVVW